MMEETADTGEAAAVLPSTLAAMRSCSLFEKLSPEMLEAVARAGKRRIFSVGQQIIHAGERGSSVFVVCSGEVSCRVGDVEVKTFSPGQSFGDMSIYCDIMYRVHEEHESILGDAGALCNLLTRKADILGLEIGMLLELSSRDLRPFFVLCPRLVYNIVRVGEEQLQEACDNHSDQALEARRLLSTLHPMVTAGFLKNVPAEEARIIIASVAPFHCRHVGRSESLLMQGCSGDSVFLVMSGLFSCQVNGKEVRHFGPWQIFGEVSLCASFPELVYKSLPEGTNYDSRLSQAVAACSVRTADVVCVEEGRVIEIAADKIVEAFRVSHQTFLNIFQLAQERFLEAIACGSIDAILRYQG